MKNIIDLERIFVGKDLLEARVKESQEELKRKMEELQAFKDQKKQEIIQELSSGKTTGDPLYDELLYLYGLNKDSTDKILAWNEKFKSATEILFVVSWSVCVKHVMIPSPHSSNEYATHSGYVYGIPSGERLELHLGKSLSDLKILVPFKRYVSWDMGRKKEIVPIDKSLLFGGGDSESSSWGINSTDFLEAISNFGQEKQDDNFGEESGWAPNSIKIFFGEEKFEDKDPNTNFEEKLRSLRIKSAFEQGRRNIQIPTPEELIKGGGI